MLAVTNAASAWCSQNTCVPLLYSRSSRGSSTIGNVPSVPPPVLWSVVCDRLLPALSFSFPLQLINPPPAHRSKSYECGWRREGHGRVYSASSITTRRLATSSHTYKVSSWLNKMLGTSKTKCGQCGAADARKKRTVTRVPEILSFALPEGKMQLDREVRGYVAHLRLESGLATFAMA